MNSYNNFDGNNGSQENAQMGALGELYGLMQGDGDRAARKPNAGRWIMVLVCLAVVAPIVAAWVLL